jgi:excisionase family DNA binding protein
MINESEFKRKKKARKQREISDGELTFSERTAARKLGISYPTINRYRAQSMISFFRVGSRILYDEECLKEFLQRRRQAAA